VKSNSTKVNQREIQRCLSELGFPFVIAECRGCDVLAGQHTPAGLWIVGNELEASAKWAIRNVQRDLANGCSGVITICTNFRVLRDVSNKFERDLPEQLHDQVGLMTLSSLRLLLPAKCSAPDPATQAEV